MFNRKSIYALNKKDPNAIVYTDADGNLIRLTCDDFACAAEFRRWKDWSDSDLRKEENADHKQSDNSISLEVLSEEATAVVSIEDEYMEQISADEAAVLVRLLRQGLSSHLTETQRRRLWKYCVEGKPVRLIAKEECAYRNAVWKSIQAAKEKMFEFLRVMFIGTQVDTMSCKGADSVCCPLLAFFLCFFIMREARIPHSGAAQCAAAPRPAPSRCPPCRCRGTRCGCSGGSCGSISPSARLPRSAG